MADKQLNTIPEKFRIHKKTGFQSFSEFFPYYLHEHRDLTNRRLHFIGTSLALLTLLTVLFFGSFKYLFLPLLVGYGFAWVGHFFFEKNKPATFKHPVWSLMGDWRMLFGILTGEIPI
eukprot:TRINITY_DN381_c0_g1_i1.p1 TRINITY_DN381_c0_g1~~TRINITY_DN381_c0_g1_i1.p1  ORF type:complete len:118 (-),score=15.70 TRINITY_DN381_c0_g1_i1:53-406(-)